MLEFEQRQRPTVAFVAEGFTRDAMHSAGSFGLSTLAVAVPPLPFTNQSPDAIREMVDGCIDQIVGGLTTVQERSPDPDDAAPPAGEWLEFTASDPQDAVDAMHQELLQRGWTDGFPMVPATEARVRWMLEGTPCDPDEVIAVLEPGFGLATVRKIAVNAVMAGCRPEHLPVIIAAIECLAEPQMYLRNKAMSTGPHAPLLWVNGPIRDEIGLNGGRCALGPGAVSYANTVIGRALRLCMMNIGHTYPGISDLDTLGSPTKYSMCVAENETQNPWEPYHVEHGYDPGSSTVTVQFTYGLCELHDFESTSPDDLAEVFGTALTNAAQVPTGLWLIGRRADPRYGTEEREHHVVFVCPEHADVFAQAGWDKARLRRTLHRHGRMPFRKVMLAKERRAMEAAHPELQWLWDSPETMVPVLEDEGCYDIVVVGGPAGRGALFFGAGQPITKPIRR